MPAFWRPSFTNRAPVNCCSCRPASDPFGRPLRTDDRQVKTRFRTFSQTVEHQAGFNACAPAADIQPGLPIIACSSACALLLPCGVSTTDLALPTGFEMWPCP